MKNIAAPSEPRDATAYHGEGNAQGDHGVDSNPTAHPLNVLSYCLELLNFQRHPDSNSEEMKVLQVKRDELTVGRPGLNWCWHYWRPGLGQRPVGQRWSRRRANTCNTTTAPHPIPAPLIINKQSNKGGTQKGKF